MLTTRYDAAEMYKLRFKILMKLPAGGQWLATGVTRLDDYSFALAFAERTYRCYSHSCVGVGETF